MTQLTTEPQAVYDAQITLESGRELQRVFETEDDLEEFLDRICDDKRWRGSRLYVASTGADYVIDSGYWEELTSE